MRFTRALTAAAALVALAAVPAAAQFARPFKDAWFWGVKGGGYNYSTYFKQSASAPSIGADWLITRSHGGLYVGFNQMFFNQAEVMPRIDTTGTAVASLVDVKNMRRLEVAAMVFPGDFAQVHPYAGLGFVFNQIASATPRIPYVSEADFNTGEDYITRRRTGTSPVLILGTQVHLRPFSTFVQLQAAPMQRNFLLYNRKAFDIAYEIGIRYNLGTSIGKD